MILYMYSLDYDSLSLNNLDVRLTVMFVYIQKLERKNKQREKEKKIRKTRKNEKNEKFL